MYVNPEWEELAKKTDRAIRVMMQDSRAGGVNNIRLPYHFLITAYKELRKSRPSRVLPSPCRGVTSKLSLEDMSAKAGSRNVQGTGWQARSTYGKTSLI
jgi:hypothetical protein